MKKFTGILISLLLPFLQGFTQSDSIPPISTDRPTQSSSPYFVPKGAFQLETGFIYTDRTDDYDERQMLSIANSNLRYGIFENFEVSVMGSYESMTIIPKDDANDTTVSGMGGVSAGFKTFVCKEKGIRPEIAIVGVISFRHLGNENFAPTFSYPLGKLVAMHNLSKRMQLGYNIGFSYNGEDADGFFVYSVTSAITSQKDYGPLQKPMANLTMATSPSTGLIWDLPTCLAEIFNLTFQPVKVFPPSFRVLL
ncbi:MAG: transporter [Bacteroidales bacterium]